MIPFTQDIQFCFKFKKNQTFLKLTIAERVKDVEFLDEDLIQVKCITSGILIKPQDEYHFTLILSSKQIPFTLSHFLESLEPTKYRGEIKHLRAKIDRGDYKERDGLLAYRKRLCSKLNSILQNFLVIRGKLEAQKAFASPRSESREKQAPRLSQRSIDTARGGPSMGRANPGPRSTFASRRPTQSSSLVSSSGQRPIPSASNLLEVADANLANAMSKVPFSYELQKKADFKHINVVYKKFWSKCKGTYIFGVDAKKELSINRLLNSPIEYNIRFREDKLIDTMVVYLLNVPDQKAL